MVAGGVALLGLVEERFDEGEGLAVQVMEFELIGVAGEAVGQESAVGGGFAEDGEEGFGGGEEEGGVLGEKEFGEWCVDHSAVFEESFFFGGVV